MILVTGAAGKTGRAVVRALAKRRVAVRAFVYRPQQIALLEQLGATEALVGDLRDEAALQKMAQGVRAIYHICPNMNPHEVVIGQQVIQAARAAGVQYFVYHSVLHPQAEQMPHHWNKLRAEEMLFESGLNYTILQPAAYMQNILGGWPAIVNQGVYQVPYAPETRLAMVDLQDVATVAATVLTESDHVGAIYELAGPENLTQIEVAAILSDCLKQPVRVEQISLTSWRQNAQAAGLDSYQLDTLAKMFKYYDSYHFCGNANVLSWLLEHPPTDFREFVERALQNKGED